MSSPIVKHEIAPHPQDDPGHPIPHLGVIDVAGYKISGGADLSIVVASPLQDDVRSHTRLLDKIEGYLAHIASDEYLRDAGIPPSPETTTIIVALHQNSGPGVYELLERCHDWVKSGNATLVVRPLIRDELGGA